MNSVNLYCISLAYGLLLTASLDIDVAECLEFRRYLILKLKPTKKGLKQDW
jgi:hypothetical protein